MHRWSGQPGSLRRERPSLSLSFSLLPIGRAPHALWHHPAPRSFALQSDFEQRRHRHIFCLIEPGERTWCLHLRVDLILSLLLSLSLRPGRSTRMLHMFTGKSPPPPLQKQQQALCLIICTSVALLSRGSIFKLYFYQ